MPIMSCWYIANFDTEMIIRYRFCQVTADCLVTEFHGQTFWVSVNAYFGRRFFVEER